jgi:hypothetical protein
MVLSSNDFVEFHFLVPNSSVVASALNLWVPCKIPRLPKLLLRRKCVKMLLALRRPRTAIVPQSDIKVGRLLGPVDGPEYGLRMNAFTESTPYIPCFSRTF